MAFFSSPRIFDAFLYYNFFLHSPGCVGAASRFLNQLTWALHVGEYLSLFTLTYVSSTENFSEGNHCSLFVLVSCSVFVFHCLFVFVFCVCFSLFVCFVFCLFFIVCLVCVLFFTLFVLCSGVCFTLFLF